MPRSRQRGPGIRAWAGYLLVVQIVSLKRAVQSLKALTGLAITAATPLSYFVKLHHALVDRGRAGAERRSAGAVTGEVEPIRSALQPESLDARRISTE